MVEGPASVLGGLPVIADVWFSRGDGYSTDDDAGVNALYWMKRDGSKGKELPKHLMDKIEEKDEWWEATVTEQVSEYLAYSQYEETKCYLKTPSAN